jgi:predicted MFS family arabinose efflux permease
MNDRKYRWVIQLLAYLCMLNFAFALQSIPPVLPLIIKGLNLTHTQAGLIMGFFALPAIFLSLAAGMLSDRLGPHRIGAIAFILLIIGNSLLAVSSRFPYAAAARLIAGAGASVLSIVAAHMISQWVKGNEIGMAMGIFNTAMPVGTIICFSTFGKLGEKLGWRMPIVVTILLGLTGIAAFLTLYKSPSGSKKNFASENTDPSGKGFSGLSKISFSMWLIGLCWMWFNTAIISFSTFAPDFLVARGYSIGYAGFLVSLLMFGSLGLSPVIGRLLDHVNNGDLFIGSGGVLIAGAIFLFSRVNNILYPLIILAIAVSFIPSPVFSFPPKLLKPEYLGLGFGILTMVSNMGIFFGPYLVGFVRDATGSYEKSFTLISCIALLLTVTAMIFRIYTRKKAVSNE